MNQPASAGRVTRNTTDHTPLKTAAQNDANRVSLAGVVAAAFAFLAAWLVVNRLLFRHALIEAGDAATIILQINNAQRFHEMLGNYSRWRFHHPGPGFIYILALGDGVF